MQKSSPSGPSPRNFPVVCVGGSAGGLDAYIRLLKHLPADLGVAIVTVNHITLMPTRLHTILPSYTTMPVDLITDRLSIEPNRAFIIPENRHCHRLHRFRAVARRHRPGNQAHRAHRK